MSAARGSLIFGGVEDLTPELQAAIANAYAAFPAARLTPPIGVCRCDVCVSEEDERLLAQTPRADLSSGLICDFTSSAHGRNDDLLRHFLPRMLELYAHRETIHWLLEVHAFEKLGPGTPPYPNADYRRHWPTEQVEALDAYFLALFRFALRGPIELRPAPAEILEMLAAAGGDPTPLLAAFDADLSHGATVGLADLFLSLPEAVWAPGEPGPGVTGNEYWARVPEGERALVEWARAPRHAARLERAMAHEADGDSYVFLAEARGRFAA